jgi:hypothetical protein
MKTYFVWAKVGGWSTDPSVLVYAFQQGAPNKLWAVSQGTGLYKKRHSVQTLKSYHNLEQNPGPL